MIFYYTLRTLAGSLNSVRGAVFSMAVSIRTIWLLGDHLYTWFSTISAYLSLLVNGLYTASNDWLTTYNELKQAGSYIPGLSELLYYVEDILSIVRDFGHNVGLAIRQQYPNLYTFNLDPVTFILETLYRYTGLSYGFVHNPIATIAGIVAGQLGDLRDLIANPYLYIVGKITQGNPLLYYFFVDPRLWLRIELQNTLPTLQTIIDNPLDFIADNAIRGIEKLLDQYGARLAKIAEKIINAML